MNTFHQLPAYLLAFTFLFTSSAKAQESTEDSEGKTIRIEVEVTEDGKTEKKVEEIKFDNLNLNELFESLDILKDIDIDVDTEDEEIEISIKRGKTTKDIKRYRFKLPNYSGESEEEHAFLGVYGKELRELVADGDDDPVVDKAPESGSYISGIVEGSGAEKAGLQKGDVIVRFDGESVEDFKSLSNFIKTKKSGDLIKLEYLRDGKKQTTDVELGLQKQAAYSYTKSWSQLGKDIEENFEGLEEQIETRMKHAHTMYSGENKAFLGITNADSEKGVEIGSVVEGSCAEKMGLKKGDQLKKVDGNSIEKFEDVIDALKEKEVGDGVELELYRDGKKMKLSGELGARENYTAQHFSWNSEDDKDEIIVRMKIQVSDPTTNDLKNLKGKTGEDFNVQNSLEFRAMEFKPNPTKGLFELKLDLINKGEAKISLYDVQGSKVFEEIISKLDGMYEQSFDIRNQPAGIYFLNVRQGAQSMTKKIIKD